MADLSAQPCAASNEVGNSWGAEKRPCRFTPFLTWPLPNVMRITPRGQDSSMLTEAELAAWYQRLNFSESTRTVIDQVRHSDPARRVGGGRSNVSGFYPSRKMGVTIQFESHRVELAAIYEMENDQQTLEFYDQPQAIALDYNSANGRRQVVRHTPDFFVIRQDAAGWEEWKTEDELHRLAEHSPNRYRREAGCWHCPPGESHASQFGLYYRLRSSKEIDWRFQRNVLFLQDYMRSDSAAVPAVAEARIVSYTCALPGISLAELIEQVANFATRDHIYLLIAAGRLYIDLHAGLLVEPAAVRVFPNRDSALQHAVEEQNNQPFLHSFPRRVQTLRAGAVVTWDGRAWQIANIGGTTVALLGEDGRLLELPDATLESLVKEGRLTQSSEDPELNTCQKISHELLHASEEDLRVANQRANAVRQRLSGENPSGSRRSGANIAPMDRAIPRRRIPIRRRVHRTVAADRSSWESNAPPARNTLAADERSYRKRLRNRQAEAQDRILGNLEGNLQAGRCSDAQLYHVLSGGAQQGSG